MIGEKDGHPFYIMNSAYMSPAHSWTSSNDCAPPCAQYTKCCKNGFHDAYRACFKGVLECENIGDKVVYEPQILGFDLVLGKLAYSTSYLVDYLHKAPLLSGLMKDPASPDATLIAFWGTDLGNGT